MKWSWKLATVRGIEIKIHISFLLVLLWGAWIWGSGGLMGALYGSFLALALFGFVVLHELGHALAAQRYAIPVLDIVLLPIGGLARFTRMPDDPKQELVVSLAGPAVNLAFALITLPIVALGVAAQTLAGAAIRLPNITQPGALNLVAFVFAINLSLLLFNMLPAFPLDGGRVLRALLALRLSHGRATRIAAAVGRAFAVVFGLVGLLAGSPSLALIALFVFFGAGAEGEEAVVQETLSGVTVADVIDPHAPVLQPDVPTHVAFERLARSPYQALAVVADDGAFMGVVTRQGMQQKWSAGVRGTVDAFVEAPSLVMRGDVSLDAARRDMASAGITVVAVFVKGCFAGLLDVAMIRRFLAFRREVPDFARA